VRLMRLTREERREESFGRTVLWYGQMPRSHPRTMSALRMWCMGFPACVLLTFSTTSIPRSVPGGGRRARGEIWPYLVRSNASKSPTNNKCPSSVVYRISGLRSSHILDHILSALRPIFSTTSTPHSVPGGFGIASLL
jgi:hypothetical protein